MPLLNYVKSKLKTKPASIVFEESASREKAIAWVKSNRLPNSGIRVHHKSPVATMEVTGYLIPTLYDAGEKKLAIELAQWEASSQSSDGSFAAPDTGPSIPYTFDTAQVIRGFLALLDEVPEFEPNLRRACDYVASQIGPSGKVTSPSYDMWRLPDGSVISDYANLYVLPPLLMAGRKLSEQRYVDTSLRALEYFKKMSDLVEFKPEMTTFSHIFGYMMEALAELGESKLAKKGLAQAAAVQRSDGAIPAYPRASWVCSTGMAQLAIAWYRVGNPEPASKALRYLQSIQNESGGFYGGYGRGAVYFPEQEISWAVKFFLDALRLKDSTTKASPHS